MNVGQPLARLAGALVIAVAALSVSGCSVPEPPGYAGEPTATGLPLTVDGPPGSEIQAWVDRDALVVTTVGSGSCPVVPVITEIDEGERVVMLSTSIPNAQGACTADSSPRTFELDAGRDLEGFTVQVTAD